MSVLFYVDHVQICGRQCVAAATTAVNVQRAVGVLLERTKPVFALACSDGVDVIRGGGHAQKGLCQNGLVHPLGIYELGDAELAVRAPIVHVVGHQDLFFFALESEIIKII